MRPDLLDNGPPGAIGVANPSGWINEELFGTWFDHFLKIVRPEVRPEPVLLILDGHTSHTKNLSVIMKARENNVIVLSLPSHTTHKLQPLDVAVFKSINSFYDQAVSTWLTQHPGRIVTEREIPELFNQAYGKGGTIRNAVFGFKKCGIFPFNPDVFTDQDFIASMVNETEFHSIADERNLQDQKGTEDAQKDQVNSTHKDAGDDDVMWGQVFIQFNRIRPI
ncbi:uncharacterized protein LOC116182980 [Photinus pyralis]|uniref:uncharacterized protein LOC116182980 n=1 Tax=Photinus pyralis TaxID=7054 RepID=UPI00126739C5|nr:uncharacterized protein LOC116182980 [Photinus pyralis]